MKLAKNAEERPRARGSEYEVEKVTDLQENLSSGHDDARTSCGW